MSMKRRADAIVGPSADRFGRAVMLELMGRVMKRTPVDNGTARANWNVSRNTPDTSTDPTAGNSSPYGTVDPAKAAENERAVQALRLFDGDTGYLANGLPYIRGLEHGRSKQAPGGMVKVTIAELRAWLRSQGGRIGQ